MERETQRDSEIANAEARRVHVLRQRMQRAAAAEEARARAVHVLRALAEAEEADAAAKAPKELPAPPAARAAPAAAWSSDDEGELLPRPPRVRVPKDTARAEAAAAALLHSAAPTQPAAADAARVAALGRMVADDVQVRIGRRRRELLDAGSGGATPGGASVSSEARFRSAQAASKRRASELAAVLAAAAAVEARQAWERAAADGAPEAQALRGAWQRAHADAREKAAAARALAPADEADDAVRAPCELSVAPAAHGKQT